MRGDTENRSDGEMDDVSTSSEIRHGNGFIENFRVSY